MNDDPLGKPLVPAPINHAPADDDLLTIAEAAALLGISGATVRQAIIEGRMEFVLKYNRKLIPRTAVADYRARTRPEGEKPRGRPKKPRE